MKELILLHWKLEECRKNNGSHKDCICQNQTLGQNSVKKNSQSTSK